jgi:hypothetical protein
LVFRDSLPVRLFLFLALCYGTHPYAIAQQEQTIITSTDRYVTLEKGASVTLKTVAAPSPLAIESTLVPAGQLLHAKFAHKISGKIARVGDRVRLKVLYAFHFESNGRTVRVPKDAVIHGHITYVAERADKAVPARLGFSVDRLAWAEQDIVLCAVPIAVNQFPDGSAFGARRESPNDADLCQTCPQRYRHN